MCIDNDKTEIFCISYFIANSRAVMYLRPPRPVPPRRRTRPRPRRRRCLAAPRGESNLNRMKIDA
jgi:hypothetical protein